MDDSPSGTAAFRWDARARIDPGRHGDSVCQAGTGSPISVQRPETVIRIDAAQSARKLLHAITQAMQCGQSFYLSPSHGCLSGGVSDLEAEQRRPGSVARDIRMLNPRGVAGPVLGVLSGGTTGSPRQILRSQKSWIRSFRRNAHRWKLGAGDTYGILGTPAHSWSLYGALEALHLGADLHLLSDIGPGTQSRLIRDGAVTVLYATPAQLRRLVRRGPAMEIHSLRLVNICGSRLDAPLAATAQKSFPRASLLEHYGTSETSFISVRDVRAMPEVGLGVIDPDVVVRVGKTAGEILVKTPSMALGTLIGDNTGHPLTLQPLTLDPEGFYATGECGHLNAEGHLVIGGRLDRQYTVADINVNPEAIETLLLSIDGVMDAAVYPASDSLRGSVSQSDILIDGQSGPVHDQTGLQSTVKAACQAQLGTLLAPRTYRFFTDPVAFSRAGPGRKSLKA